MTSSSSGSRRSASAGSSASRRSSRSGVLGDADALAALRARHRADVDRVELRPRPVGPVALREPVHDRVAAVDEHDEEHADLVGDRAPQRGDLVERGAVADDRQHRAVLARHPHADRRRQREAEHPHRADEAARRGGGDARVQLGPARRRLLEQDRVVRQPLGQRGEHVAGAQRLARARRRRRGRALAGGRGGRGPRVDGLGQRGADRGRLAEHGELDRAAVGLGGVLRDDRDAGARLDQRPLVVGVLPEGARPHDEEGVVGAEHARATAPAGQAGARRSADGPGGSRPGLRTAPATPGSRGARRAPRARPSPRRRRRRPRRRSRARRRRRAGPRARRPTSGSAPAERSSVAGPRISCGSGPGAVQSSIGTITIAGPRAVAASW